MGPMIGFKRSLVAARHSNECTVEVIEAAAVRRRG